MEIRFTGECAETDLDRSMKRELAQLVSHLGLIDIGEVATCTHTIFDQLRQVVDPDDHVLGRSHDRPARGG